MSSREKVISRTDKCTAQQKEKCEKCRFCQASDSLLFPKKMSLHVELNKQGTRRWTDDYRNCALSKHEAVLGQNNTALGHKWGSPPQSYRKRQRDYSSRLPGPLLGKCWWLKRRDFCYCRTPGQIPGLKSSFPSYCEIGTALWRAIQIEVSMRGKVREKCKRKRSQNSSHFF